MKVKIKSTGEIVDVKPTGKKDSRSLDLYSYVKNEDFNLISEDEFEEIKDYNGSCNAEQQNIPWDNPYKTTQNPNNPIKSTNWIIVAAVFVILVLVIIFTLENKKENNSFQSVYSDSAQIITNVPGSVIDLEQQKEIAAKTLADGKVRDSLIKHTIKITSAYLDRPNSAGGCDAYLYYKNISDKTIKYLVWEGSFYNAVGDPVSCEIRDEYSYRGRDTGPVKPGRTGGGYWDCVIYNNSARKLNLISVEIEYMDGSTITLDSDEIRKIRK